jgi:hypothetical protein
MATRIAAILLTLAADPRVSTIQDDEQIVLFPTLGYRAPGEHAWTLEVHGWIFEPEWSKAGLATLQTALGLASPDIEQADRAVFADRVRGFLVDNERDERIVIQFDNATFSADPSTSNGHFHGDVHLPDADIQRLTRGTARATSSILTYRVVVPSDRYDVFRGEVHLIEAYGLSVISDIDDTIKVSEVSDHGKLLANTFLRPFRDVPGMADMCRTWAEEHSASFHYVSASPWQLYPALREFMEQKRFPHGTFHLKYFRWKDKTFLSLFESPQEYKRATITPILDRFPHRRFVLLGDSGEKDPEAFARLARTHPAQIERILIRDVTGEAADAQRYRDLFADLPQALWQVFSDPEEIRIALP